MQITDTAGQVLTILDGKPTWASPKPEANPELVLRCGACGTKHEANTKRCDACGCSNRMEDISESKLEAIMQKRRDYFSVFRRAFKSFSGGGTESPGPC